MMGKAFTSVLTHRYAREMNERGALPPNTLDSLGNNVNPLHQHDLGKVFAAFLNGNNKQQFSLDIYLHATWYPDEKPIAWSIYIGCTQGHSTGVVLPSQISHRLKTTERLS